MIKIVCIKWDGKDYNAEYVNRLYRGIKRNTSVDFSFICFADHPTGLQEEIDYKPLPVNLGNWYNKIALYNKEHYSPEDQIFFFDLDTVIVGSLDDILKYEGNFIILRDFSRPKGYGSGLMAWKPEAVHHMWEKFTPTWKSNLGDQGWPELHMPKADLWQVVYPGKVISFKVDVMKRPWRNMISNGNIEEASIVCFHGTPKPRNCTHPEVLKHWI